MPEVMLGDECVDIKNVITQNEGENIDSDETMVEKNNFLVKKAMVEELEHIGLSKEAICRQLNIKGGAV